MSTEVENRGEPSLLKDVVFAKKKLLDAQFQRRLRGPGSRASSAPNSPEKSSFSSLLSLSDDSAVARDFVLGPPLEDKDNMEPGYFFPVAQINQRKTGLHTQGTQSASPRSRVAIAKSAPSTPVKANETSMRDTPTPGQDESNDSAMSSSSTDESTATSNTSRSSDPDLEFDLDSITFEKEVHHSDENAFPGLAAFGGDVGRSEFATNFLGSSPVKRKRAPLQSSVGPNGGFLMPPTQSGGLNFSPNSSPFSQKKIRGSSRAPTSAQRKLYSDRYIPSRTGSRLQGWGPDSPTDASIPQPAPAGSANVTPVNTPVKASQESEVSPKHVLHSMLMRKELLGEEIDVGYINAASAKKSKNGQERVKSTNSLKMPRRTFRFSSPLKPIVSEMSPYDVGPLASPNVVCPTISKARYIASKPYKILDAPTLKDDFYLNLVDWGSSDLLAVGLGKWVYLWSARTTKVQKLCQLNEGTEVTCVKWNSKGNRLAVGNSNGQVDLYDSHTCKVVRSLQVDSTRVGTIAWNSRFRNIAMGTRNGSICTHDTRVRDPVISRLTGHRHEVCGLKWSPDQAQLASGGNDNKLMIWDAMDTSSALCKFSGHSAAVKAIAWSPHQQGLLASGGGTADRTIRFWNTATAKPIRTVDTGSQVCTLGWAKSVNEVVSTHGYSLNQIIVWRYPTMQQVATLTGHSTRVLYMAMSPDGSNVVTGAGDETLRFWNLFPSEGSRSRNDSIVAFDGKFSSIR